MHLFALFQSMQKKASIIALIGLIKLYKDNIVSVIYIFQYFNLNESRVKKNTKNKFTMDFYD